MSTRWYRIYQKGNPQLRVFLPNFWMKIVKPEELQPPNIVQFHCSLGMTKLDVKNYLEKIYNVKVKDVRTRIKLGKFKQSLDRGYIIKEDDVKVAYAILPKEESFIYPDIYKNSEKEEGEQKKELKVIDEMKENTVKFLQANNKPGVPGWFGI